MTASTRSCTRCVSLEGGRARSARPSFRWKIRARRLRDLAQRPHHVDEHGRDGSGFVEVVALEKHEDVVPDRRGPRRLAGRRGCVRRDEAVPGSPAVGSPRRSPAASPAPTATSGHSMQREAARTRSRCQLSAATGRDAVRDGSGSVTMPLGVFENTGTENYVLTPITGCVE